MVYMLAAGFAVLLAAVADVSGYLRESLELVPLPRDVQVVILVRLRVCTSLLFVAWDSVRRDSAGGGGDYQQWPDR